MKQNFLLLVFAGSFLNLFCPIGENGIRYISRGGSCQSLLMAAVQHGEDTGVDGFLEDSYTAEQLQEAREWAQGKLECGYDSQYRQRLCNIIVKIKSKENNNKH